jgi:hypothetical protein
MGLFTADLPQAEKRVKPAGKAGHIIAIGHDFQQGLVERFECCARLRD